VAKLPLGSKFAVLGTSIIKLGTVDREKDDLKLADDSSDFAE
jgi:hypothetical protein